MSSRAVVDLFAEDLAHEELIGAMVRRVAQQHGKTLDLRIRSARGGRASVLSELKLYQRMIGAAGGELPEVVVAAIDANCSRFRQMRSRIEEVLEPAFRHLVVTACPEPHVERWFLADPPSFYSAVGIRPNPGRRKCERGRYKSMLANLVVRAGHVPTLGGIEFARELVETMDFYRAGRAERSLKAFVEELSSRLTSS